MVTEIDRVTLEARRAGFIDVVPKRRSRWLDDLRTLFCLLFGALVMAPWFIHSRLTGRGHGF